MPVNLFKISLYTVLVFCPVIYSLKEDFFKDSQHRVRRAVEPVEFDVDGEKFTFNFVLPKHDVYSRHAPVWLANSKPGNSPNYTYDLVENSTQMVKGLFYVDNDKKAVVLAHLNKNKVLYDGLFGENNEQHIIKSRSDTRRTRLRSGRKNGDHVIYRSTLPNLYFPAPKSFEDLFVEKLEKPLKELYPKLLIVVDNHLFKKLGSDVAQTIKYVATFWNKVNQKYSEIESPKVNIMITGIIIANDEKALNFIYQSTLTAERTNGSVANTLNEKTAVYFHNEFHKVMDFQNYDLVVVMTGQDTHSIAGQAFIAMICANWYNTAFIRDYGDYSGVFTGVHELAHSLNVQHDPTDTSECGFVAADKTVSVMYPFTRKANGYFWSKCSKKSLQDFAALKAAECLRYRYPVPHYQL